MAVGEVFEQLHRHAGFAYFDRAASEADRLLLSAALFYIPRWTAAARTDATLQGSSTLDVTSRDVLAAISRGEGPTQALVALGYAGWGAGQLEEEIRSNAWLNVPVDDAILFQVPFNYERWQAAMKLLVLIRRGSRVRRVMPDSRGQTVALGFDYGQKRIGVASGDSLTSRPTRSHDSHAIATPPWTGTRLTGVSGVVGSRGLRGGTPL
jgi:hypothetical protein